MIPNGNGTEGFTTKEMLQRIDRKLDDLTKCTADLTTQAQLNKTKIGSHDGDLNRHENILVKLDEKIDDLNRKSNFWDGLNTAFIAIAGALNILTGGKQ